MRRDFSWILRLCSMVLRADSLIALARCRRSDPSWRNAKDSASGTVIGSISWDIGYHPSGSGDRLITVEYRPRPLCQPEKGATRGWMVYGYLQLLKRSNG